MFEGSKNDKMNKTQHITEDRVNQGSGFFSRLCGMATTGTAQLKQVPCGTLGRSHHK